MSIASQLIESFEERLTSSSDARHLRKQFLIAEYMRNATTINEVLFKCYEFPYISIILNQEAQEKIARTLGVETQPGCVGPVTEFLEAIGFNCEATGGVGDLRIEPCEASSVDF